MQASDTPTTAWLLLFGGCLAFTTFMVIVAVYVIRLNQQLRAFRDGLRSIDGHVVSATQAQQ